MGVVFGGGEMGRRVGSRLGGVGGEEGRVGGEDVRRGEWVGRRKEYEGGVRGRSWRLFWRRGEMVDVVVVVFGDFFQCCFFVFSLIHVFVCVWIRGFREIVIFFFLPWF